MCARGGGSGGDLVGMAVGLVVGITVGAKVKMAMSSGSTISVTAELLIAP
jgi:hypothetical protein